MQERWQESYRDKVSTLERAIAAIAPGRRILIGSGAAEPTMLVDALVEHGSHLVDNEIVHLLTLGPAPYLAPGLERRFRHTAFFIGPNSRAAVQEGRADFMPVFLSDIPELMRSRRVRIDVALIQVSPPDRHGYCSLGVSIDVVRAGVDAADLVLAEVNPNMPRTLGDSFLHVSRIHHLVPVDHPLHERTPEPIDEISRAIGANVASLVPHGATLQLGIGRLPDATLAALDHHEDLGVHTEMFADGVMDLVEKGVITGRRKSILPGKIVASFVMGSRKLYDWVHENPGVEMRPTQFTNDPFTIARHDNMIAINSALAVDLTGQVASDTLMGRFFSGIGGQVDFIRGAARSRGGKPIIALASTAKRGSVSRIRPALEEGAGVVTSRGDVRYVVTEFGIADLWGRNIRQRALALIDIAHPDHRAELLAAAKQRHYVFLDQPVPRSSEPWEHAAHETLQDGERVVVRPVRIADEPRLKDLFYRLADNTTYKRFMARRGGPAHEELRHLVDLEHEEDVALVVCRATENDSEIVAIGRYDVDRATQLADLALVVEDSCRGRGIGSLLMRRLADLARARGIAGFMADASPTNKSVMLMFHASGLHVHSDRVAGVDCVVATFDLPVRGARASLEVDPALGHGD